MDLIDIASSTLIQFVDASSYGKVWMNLIDVASSTLMWWSGGAMVLGKLLVPGRPTNLDYRRARAFCACRRCGWGLFGHFCLIYRFSLLSPSLWETVFQSISDRLPERRRKRRERIDVSKNVQTTPTRTFCKRSRPLPTVIQIVGRPGTGSLPSTIAPPDHPLIWV